ncbi:flippase [Variovorax sp. PvP013]|jgi:O-antigen/teichoic acid export membrane protein|uniref:flippase n=1 Tax=Variovorax sp. PvP013 TaxID=3156435 RepID=UPI003D1B1175
MSLRRNILWNLAGAGLPLLAGAAFIPYLLREAGVEIFGILTLVWALIGYFSLFDFGLGRALTQQVAQRLGVGSVGEVPALVKGGLGLTLATGLAGGVLLAAFSHPLAVHWLSVSEGLQHDVWFALLIAAVSVPVTTVTVGLRGVLEAYEDFRDVNLLRMLLGLANFGLPALSVWCFGPSLVPMVAGLMVVRLVFCLAHWMLVRRRLPGGFGTAALHGVDLRRLLTFGAWMTVSNIVSPLMVTGDRFVISAVLGAAVVAYYTVPSEVMARVLILPAALTGALFPRLASLMTATDLGAARRLYRQCIAVVAAALLPLCLALGLGAHWGLSHWLGADFADRSAPVVSFLALGLLLNGIAFVPFAAVQAAGLARVTAQLHVIEALIYFPLLWLGMSQFGLIGAAMAWSLRVGIDLVLLLIVAQRRIFRRVPSSSVLHNLPSFEPESP